MNMQLYPGAVFCYTNRMRRLTLVWFAWLMAASAFAERPVTRLYTADDGLARNWVGRIRRDHRGRLWFCTVEGLSLFDGEKFYNYTAADGLPNRNVNDILDAGDGSYWLATDAGLHRFRPRTTAPPVFDKVPLDGVNQAATVLLRARNGDLWCGTQGGLYRVRPGGKQHGELTPLTVRGETGLALPTILALAEDRQGSLWIGSGRGLLRYDSRGVWRFPAGCMANPRPMAKALHIDREGRLWAAYTNGISRLDLSRDPPVAETTCFDSQHSFADVQTFYESSAGEFWIGGFGLAHLRGVPAPFPGRFENFDRKTLLGSQYIYGIAEDLARNLWAAVGRNGVMRILRPGFGQFTEADGLESGYVHSVFEGWDGTLYAVTGRRHTLNRFDGERFHPIDAKTPSEVTEFGYGDHAVTLEDRHGEWWMATGAGLLRYPSVARPEDLARTPPSAHYTKTSGLPGDSITRVYQDRDRDIWIGTYGIARWKSDTGKLEDWTATINQAMGASVGLASFAQDGAGDIWMGFYPRGLARFRDGRWESVRDGLPTGQIGALLVDQRGRLWVGSGLAGVARIDEPAAAIPRFNYYLRAGGLRSDHVAALAEDRAGRIYVAGGRGVDRLDPATGSVINFAAGSGPPPGETHELFRDRNGAIWFGSSSGLARYLPEPDPTGPPPSPAIHEVRVSGAPVLVSDEGEAQVQLPAFPAGRHSIAIGFGSVDFSVGNRVRYRYRLLPVESNWSEPAASRSVQYAGLGPNRYDFEVQAVGPTGLFSPAGAGVRFRVQAPFWKTSWFLLLAGGSIAALGYSAYLYRLRHQLALERVRARVAADVHDDMGSGLAEIAIMTEVASREAPALGLDAVARRARELRAAMNDIVWSVDPAGDSLEALINRWRQTAFALLGDDRLEFLAPAVQEISRVALDPDQRRQLLLIFKEVVTNVARHAGANRVRIQVKREADLLNLEIRDDGCGFDPAHNYPGSGLKNMRSRAEALHGTLAIDSQPGAGCIVTLRVPIA